MNGSWWAENFIRAYLRSSASQNYFFNSYSVISVSSVAKINNNNEEKK